MLLSFEKRRTVEAGKWSTKGAIWIRTWYGNEDGSGEEPVVTRTSADEAYLQLWRKALFPEDMDHEFDENMFGPFVFDDNDACKVSARDSDDEVQLMDEIPSFILSALVRCPDVMEASQQWKDIEEDDALTSRQQLLVVMADGEACEEGWSCL